MVHMQSGIDALPQSLIEMTIEVVNFRAAVSSNLGAMSTINAKANAAWGNQAKIKEDLEKDIEEVQGQVRRGGGPNRDEHGSRWNIRMESGELLALRQQNLEPCAESPSLQSMADALDRAGETNKAALLRSMIPEEDDP